MTTAAIEIRGLQKRLGTFVLGPVDLTVPTGSIYGLIGPNGAGKTTTIDLILGMGREDAGTIAVFGLDHWKQEVEIKRRVGYVSPDLSYVLWKKVNWLADFLRPYYPTWDDDYFFDLLNRFGIDRLDSIKFLSFGNKTKLAVAAALAHRPDLLLLDEPTIGVDAVSKKQIFTELLDAVQNENRTVLISSHNLADIERFADHIGMIKYGRMVLEGRTDELVERFRAVDFTYTGDIRSLKINGVYMQNRHDNRFHALMDTRNGAAQKIVERGGEILATAPVSLEELFVGLVEG